MHVILAVDVGSSSVRCIAYSHEPSSCIEEQCGSLRQIAAGAPSRNQPDEHGRFDPDALVAAANEAVSGCLAVLRQQGKFQIQAIGFACFAMSLIGTDIRGQAMTPCYSYAESHPTTAVYAQKLRKDLCSCGDLLRAYQRTGTPVHIAYAAPTLMRLQSDEPGVFRKISCWQTFTSFLLSVWTSQQRVPVSYSEASWTGLLNRHSLTWDEGMLNAVGLPKSALPPLCDYDCMDPMVISDKYANMWPELKGVRLTLGFGDGAMANIGSKCVNAQRIAATIGTSAALRVVVPSDAIPNIPCGLWCYRIDRKHSLLGGALTDGGNVHAWVSEAVGKQSVEAAGADAGMAPGKHGLTVLPFLSSERSPGWNDTATGVIYGITRRSTGQDIARAMLEGVILRMTDVVQLLSPHVAPDAVVVASGTALTASLAWKQMVADAFGRKLLVDESTSEATSRGVAVMACRALLAIDGLGAASQPFVVEPLSENVLSFEPDATRNKAYTEALDSQKRLYSKLFGPSWLSSSSAAGWQAVLAALCVFTIGTTAAAFGFAIGRRRAVLDR